MSETKTKSKSIKGIIFLMLIPLIGLLALWTWITLSFTYSTGTRAGFLQKFSKKGFLCKTWEGELVTGTMLGNQEKFAFSVRDADLAKLLESNTGERIQIEYDQHLGVPTSCFAETEFYVKNFKAVPESPNSFLPKATPIPSSIAQ